jgi:tripartite-type tricarboxylate transporter receptor subunit TctC
MVAYISHENAGLLQHLAPYAILKALARFQESREDGMHAGRPCRLPRQQAAAAIVDQHDDSGVGAGKMLGAAGWVGAVAAMAGIADHGFAAAYPAEAMPAVPPHDTLGIGQERAVVMRQEGADRTQIGEGPAARETGVGLGIGDRADVEREIDGLAHLAQHDGVAQQGAIDRIEIENEGGGCCRLADRGDEVATLPDRHQTGMSAGEHRCQPFGVAAAMTDAVEGGMGVEVDVQHPAKLARQSGGFHPAVGSIADGTPAVCNGASNARTVASDMPAIEQGVTLMLRSIGRALPAIALVAVLAMPAAAQDYPDRLITMVVPFAAGGPTDTVGRLIADKMSQSLGQQVIVENVGGAGGTLGASRVAKAAPDGYTLLLYHIGQATSGTLYRDLDYDPGADFAPIGIVTDVPMIFVARGDFPAATMQELVDYVKANPDTVTMGNAGIGSASHLCGMMFMAATGTQVTTVSYKGTGPAMNDLLGGVFDFMCDQTTNTTSQIKAGSIKPYAATTESRVASLPDIPTTAEAGFPDFRIGVWHGLYAPAGTPQPVIDELAAALREALASPDVAARFADLGTAPATADEATPTALGALVASETAKWKPIIEAAGVYAD